MKDFSVWHKVKTKIDNFDKRLFFQIREVWWCSMGFNVGFEQDGKGEKYSRPVVVFKKFNNEVFLALPLSTKGKSTKFYFPIDLGDGLDRYAILSQIRLIDAKRLIDKIGVVSEKDFAELKKAAIALYE